MDDWAWKVGSCVARFGWWFVHVGAAIAWRNKDQLPWKQ